MLETGKRKWKWGSEGCTHQLAALAMAFDWICALLGRKVLHLLAYDNREVAYTCFNVHGVWLQVCFVVGHGDSEAGCGNTRAVQLCCTVGGSHLVYGAYLFLHHIYTQAPSNFYCFLFFLINAAHFIARKLANMENLPTCDQKLLTSGDLLSRELGDSTCYCQTRILITIHQCIDTECSASDKDIFDAYIFDACEEVDYSATSTISEGPRNE